ncbi:MAG: ABC transporter substrate-binding protein [Gammaproteobacteria bacterium]
MPYFYPTYWESQTSCGRYFISMGAIPNQQLDFFIPFLIEKFGPKIYCVGQDYNWPRVSIAYIEQLLPKHGGELVGRCNVPFDQSDWSSIIQRVKSAQPDVFFPFIGGNGLVACLKQFYDFGFDGISVAATLMDEMYLPQLRARVTARHVLFGILPDGTRQPRQQGFCEQFQSEIRRRRDSQ